MIFKISSHVAVNKDAAIVITGILTNIGQRKAVTSVEDSYLNKAKKYLVVLVEASSVF